MEGKGFIIAGTNTQSKLVEIIEVAGHPWFIACQFHPEFQSKPDKAHPLFREFVKAAKKYKAASMKKKSTSKEKAKK